MKTLIKVLACVSLVFFIFFVIFFINNPFAFILDFTVVFGLLTYHLWMRLIVAAIINKVLKDKIDYRHSHFYLKHFEMRLYKILKVKKWKDKIPKYDEEDFDISRHSWEEIAQATCHSEIIHKICFVLSFLPLIFVAVYGGYLRTCLFVSIVAALCDLVYIIIQRYNRARIMRIIYLRKKRDSAQK